MAYTNDLIKYARQLEQPISVEYSEQRNLYKVWIDKVGFKNGYVRHPIHGFGCTIEDACNDFIRQARGGELTHYITEQTIFIV
jgi:hypothetical protein